MSTWAKVEFTLEVGGSAAAATARFVELWSRTTIPDITAIPDDLSSKSGIPCQNITICDKAG